MRFSVPLGTESVYRVGHPSRCTDSYERTNERTNARSGDESLKPFRFVTRARAYEISSLSRPTPEHRAAIDAARTQATANDQHTTKEKPK